jgi:hypothetical protein
MTTIGAASDWILATLSESLATSIITIAVAVFGIALLSGQMRMRRGFALVLGCFILIGASEITRSMIGILSQEPVPPMPLAPVELEITALPPLGPEPAAQPPHGNPFDPYGETKPVN